MKILGVIAEYDPFHHGHARHLQLAREAVKPDFTLIALSGCVKQRGSLALLSPYDRARCALEHGADAVFALPTLWTVRDAEHYASGAVHLLRGLGATHLAFGAEEERLEVLERTAEILEHPPAEFSRQIQRGLGKGMGYPSAVSAAMDALDPECGRSIRSPNNILGIHYLRAIQRLRAPLQPVLIPRTGAYFAEEIDPEAPSASALRETLLRGDYAHAMEAVPEGTKKALRSAFLAGNIPREEVLDHLLIHRLRTLSREEARQLPDLSEGLEDRLLNAAGQGSTREDILELVSGKRYPRARISRLCAWALLGGTEDLLREAQLPASAVLLGLRKDPRMTALWQDSGIHISHIWQSETDLAAWKLWAACTGQAGKLPWTHRVITL